MTSLPGYRIEWRANKTGTWAHAVISVHEWVACAVISDPNGGPYSGDDLDRQLSDCRSRNNLVRPERRGDKRCGYCLYLVATLDEGINRVRREWAIGKLDSAIEALAAVAPIGDPEHVIGE